MQGMPESISANYWRTHFDTKLNSSIVIALFIRAHFPPYLIRARSAVYRGSAGSSNEHTVHYKIILNNVHLNVAHLHDNATACSLRQRV